MNSTSSTDIFIMTIMISVIPYTDTDYGTDDGNTYIGMAVANYSNNNNANNRSSTDSSASSPNNAYWKCSRYCCFGR